MFEQILVQFAALAGYAAFVSVLINIFKTAGIVKDGESGKWVAALDLLGVIALYVARVFFPDLNIEIADGFLKEIAAIGIFILSTIGTILASKATYVALKGLPLVGKSFSEEARLKREKEGKCC